MNIRPVIVTLALGCSLVAASACSPKPAPEQPLEAQSEGNETSTATCGEKPAQSPEHCECLGGYVKGDIGDGQVACNEGETELERVQQGIEGAVCCKANTL